MYIYIYIIRDIPICLMYPHLPPSKQIPRACGRAFVFCGWCASALQMLQASLED